MEAQLAMENSNLFLHFLEIAKCGICEKYLSDPPVFYTDTLGSICCECQHAARSTGSTLERQMLYESLSKSLIFPCSYKKLGCDVQVIWGEAKFHENTCQYREVQCPISLAKEKFIDFPEDCQWSGSAELLNCHIQRHHAKYVRDASDLIWKQGKDTIIFITKFELIFIVIIKYDPQTKMYFCTVACNCHFCDNFYYLIKFRNDTKERSVVYDRQHNICTLRGLFTIPDILIKGLEVNIEGVKEVFGGNLFIAVEIEKKQDADLSCREIIASNSSKTQEGILGMDQNVLQELECPVCNEYMVPPIRICPIGHSICNSCSQQVSICPSCRRPMKDARNFTLEKVTSFVNYPCRKKTVGCTVITTLDKIKTHEKSCSYSEKRCIMGCEWEGTIADMMNHLTNNHQICPTDMLTIQMRDLKNLSICKDVMFFDGKIFLLSVKNSTRGRPNLMFNMACVGEVEQVYKFELSFVDSTGPDLKLIIEKFCEPFTEANPVHSALSSPHYFSISYELLEPFIFQERFVYHKIRISKVF